MTDKKSGIETWNFVSNFDRDRRDSEIALPVFLAFACSIGVVPFAIIRLMHAEYAIAFVDFLVIVGMLMLGTWIYRTRQVRIACVVMAGLCVIGICASTYVSGPKQILWAYPTVLAIFYLLRPGEAVTTVLVMVGILMPILLSDSSSFQTASIVITLVLMAAFTYAFAAMNNRQRVLLTRLATKDPLTGVGNRRALDAKLAEVVAARGRSPSPASLIILDLDHFKAVNDTHGHAKGDEILQRVAEIVNLRIRVTDSLYRIGGEEFVVVAEHQDLEKATHLAEQLRLLVEANELVDDRAVTISLGVAQLADGEEGGDWLCRADEALYAAKRGGRNATVRAA